MQAEQISIFLENKEGRLAQVTFILADAGINIRALSLADTSDFGVLRIIVDDSEKAEKVLKENGLTVGKTSVVAIEVDDNPGGLNNILNILERSKVNVEYMYGFAQKVTDNAVMIFKFDPVEEAITILKDNGISIISKEDLYKL